MKEQYRDGSGDQEEDGGHEVGKGKGESLEELDVAKDVGILFRGFGEEASKARAYHTPQTPNKGHNGKGSWLKFLLWDHLCYHCSNDSN